MEISRQIVRDLRMNYKVIKTQLDELSHEDVRLQPLLEDHLRWNLGSIVFNRGRMMALLGMEPLWDEVEYERYATDARSFAVTETGLPLNRIFADLTSAQEHLLAQIKRMSNVDFSLTPAGHEQALGDQLHDFVWHDTYHAGQMGGLCQLAGISIS